MLQSALVDMKEKTYISILKLASELCIGHFARKNIHIGIYFHIGIYIHIGISNKRPGKYCNTKISVSCIRYIS